jgi:hypothetical protein
MGNVSILIFHNRIQTCVKRYFASYICQVIILIKHIPIQKSHAGVALHIVWRRIRDIIGIHLFSLMSFKFDYKKLVMISTKKIISNRVLHKRVNKQILWKLLKSNLFRIYILIILREHTGFESYFLFQLSFYYFNFFCSPVFIHLIPLWTYTASKKL